MKFTALKKHIESEGVQPVYLFEGEELYFRDKGVEMIKAACLSQPQLNYTAFDGAALKGDKISRLAEAVYALPFLSEKRVVVVTEFYPAEREYAAYLRPIFEKPVESTALLIVNAGGKPKAGSCEWKKKPNVTFVDCGRADEQDAVKWVYLTLRRAGIRADGRVCTDVVRYCGGNMARIAGETEKLKEYAEADGRAEITSEIVDALVYRDAEYKLYELSQAAARRDHTRFVQIMESMVGKGYDENAFLNALCSHFRTLYEVSSFKGSDRQAAEALGMKEYAVKKSREQAARFDKDALGGYYADLYGVLARARAGEITFSAALKMSVGKIFFKTY